MRNLFKTSTGTILALYVLCVVLFFLLQHNPLNVSAQGLSMPLAQLVVFPFVVLMISFLKIQNKKMPLPLVFFIFGAALISMGFNYSVGSFNRKVFLFAKMHGDELEAASRIFRERVQHQLERLGSTRVHRYHSEINSHKEARPVLGKGDAIRAMIWGGARWITVSLPRQEALSVQEIDGGRWPELHDVELVTAVPVVGLPRHPEYHTTAFLAHLFEALSAGDVFRTPFKALEREGVELDLVSAGRYGAQWHSFAHRAYPYWLLGNLYLRKALVSDPYEGAYLKCAMEYYSLAQSYIRTGDNPELYSAILNNYSVALFARTTWTKNREIRQRARSKLKGAMSARNQKNLYAISLRAPRVASRNFKRLFRNQKKQGNKKAHNKRRTS